MKLLPSRLLLLSLCVLSPWSVSSVTLVVTQSPDVSVKEGGTVNITCCWTGHVERLRVNWLKNQTEIKNESLSIKNQSNNCLNLSFSHITRENTGRYICRVTVEIPVYSVINGNGTIITVSPTEKINESNTGHNTTGAQSLSQDWGQTQTAREDQRGARLEEMASASHSMDVLIHVLRFVPLLLLLLTFFYFNHRWTKSQQHRAAATQEEEEEGDEEEKGDERETEAE
ncbi:uncharacterized protein LOC113157199 isoform X1 [Anabas testudineus]|uniref:uncharacterized protein LOC113157199 isoform X1 n=1 Tax=Anabas testudineus TaxID=64144 RepID=UPI000E453AD1|nr:uncharacterized protein LOC113157199 isoform X1 [Anabas testudineus]